ncbi:hypothetical protein G3M48_009322 [Beauveria asiatica]|uniref:Uncharacterized protein n=1 Tax=Beauveria asiatica TaxID=1069075 RepID=A0AAW0RIW4_9HYPO
MSTPLFCCSSIRPYRPQHLAHESKFTSFVTWASFPTESRIDYAANLRVIHAPFAIQLVRQVNYGPLESKRYFIPHADTKDIFDEVVEDDLIRANFQKLNAYKNFKRTRSISTTGEPTWRDRREIDLPPQAGPGQAQSSVTVAGDSATAAKAETDIMDREATIACRLSELDREDHEPMKDLTACDKECGYCGECDY